MISKRILAGSSVLLLFLCASGASAQMGCSDAGICSLNGHSSEAEQSRKRWHAGLSYIQSANKSFSYHNVAIGGGLHINRRLRLDMGINYVAAEALSLPIPVRSIQQRKIFVDSSFDPITRDDIGDLSFSMHYNADELDPALDLSASATIPLTDVDHRYTPDLQTTVGSPTFGFGASYRFDKLVIGAAFQHSFGIREFLERAPDAAVTARYQLPISSTLEGGLDASLVYHLGNDLLFGERIDSTSGATLNLGGSLRVHVSHAIDATLFGAAPIFGIKHVDGLKRSFVGGVRSSYSW